MNLYYALLVLIVSTLTDALILKNPLNAHQSRANCGQVCPRSLPQFVNLELGNTYIYNLESNTKINVKETQSVGISARVEITPQNVCEFTLQLRQVQLTGVPDPTEMQRLLESNPLQFGSFDGKVLGVCPANDEEIWALNIKKSILSALQMSAKSVTEATTVTEDDFSGQCATSYTPISSDDSTVIIQKSKSLNNCQFRRVDLSGFNTRTLSLLTEFVRQKYPLLRSGSVCTQQIENRIITSVSCTEDNTVSFQEDSLVSSSLSLKFVEKTQFNAANLKLVENGPPEHLHMQRKQKTPKESVESDVLSLLGTICSQVSGEHLSPETTQSFRTLVQSLKGLSESATQRIDAAVKSGEICPSPKLRDLFIGASAFAASDASIQTIVNAYNNKEFSYTRSTILFTLIALKSKPTEKTINVLLPLLESKEIARPLLLGISLLIKNYCETVELCEEIPAVKQTVDVLLAKLRNSNCNLERITIIKSLDNICQKSSESLKTSLLDLATNSSMDSGVRVAAIQMLTRVSDNNIRERLIDILLKDTEEVEVRIAAYKSVVMSGATVEQLERILSEKDAKIENYIRTHIRNLKNSRNSNRQKILPQNAPKFEEPKSYSLGITRNIEYSYRGATIEGDVIHPKGSLVPSVLNLNVWVPVHGKDLQLLEISIRHVGLDAHIKKIIGRGIYGPEISLRIAEELAELIEHIKDPNHSHSTILQLSVRISGKNVLFLDTFEDIHTMSTLLIQRLKSISQLDSLDRALGAVLLDTAVEFPSLNGFPIKAYYNDIVLTSIKGSINTETTEDTPASKSKIRKIRSHRSVLGELSAGLKLKVGNYKPGFEYRMHLSFTPFVDALIESKDRQILKARINLPKEKQTILKLKQSTQLFDAYGKLKESNEVADNEQESTQENTRCKTSPNFGISICKVRNPVENSPVPNVEYYISKDDKSMEAIELLLERPPRDSKEVRVWRARITAPNSENNKEITAEIQLLTPSEGLKELKLKFESPTSSVSTHASILADKDGANSIIELEFKCSKHMEFKIKSVVNRTAEQKNLDLTIDYKFPHSNKETIKYVEKSSLNFKRNKKTKIINVSFSSELSLSQFPKYNSQISYYTQLRPYQSSKSELNIGWNQDYKDKIRLSHTSKMDVIELRPFKMTSENALVVEATPFDINYDFKLNLDASVVKNRPKLLKVELIGKDVNGREDREIRGSIDFERVDSPLAQTINATLKYPGRELAYYSEVKQVKELSFVGLMRYQLQKGRVVTVEHKESMTNPTKDFKFESDSEVSYSYSPDKYSYSTVMSWDSETLEYKHSVLHNSQKFIEWILSMTMKGKLKAFMSYEDKSVDLDVDSIWNPKSAQIDVKNKQKAYKINAKRVPKESITLKLDSTLNSRLKELEAHVSRVDKSSIKLVTSEGVDVKGYIDLLSDNKRAHIDIQSPKRGYSHTGDLKYLGSERSLIIDSKTNKNGKPYITIEGQLSCNNRSYLIAKKIKSDDDVSKFEYFYDKGIYGLVIDSSRFTGFIEGENKARKFGKLGFFDKVNNYEHTSNYSIDNGILAIKSISNKDKETFTKFDAVAGLRIVSNITLITPKINSQLIVNPLGEKKTIKFDWVSPRYDQKTVIEIIPRNEIKIESLTQRKVEPLKRYKVDALITRKRDSIVTISAPDLDVVVRKTKSPKPKYIFNTTLNGYNEIQEFDVNQNLHPLTNLGVALYKYFKSYTVSDD